MSKPTFLGPLLGKAVGQCELVYAERGTVLASQVEPAFDSQTRKRGLLGRESIPGDYVMIIAPCSAVHTISMRVPLDLVFVARNGIITKTCRGVKPWRVAGSMKAYAVIEAAEGFIDKHEIVPGEAVALRETAAVSKGAAPGEAPVGHQASAVPPTIDPQHASGEPGAPPARQTRGKRVTLADVVARKTPLAWFESVAIVQELCEAVLTRGPADDLRIPELKHIALTGDGKVLLLGNGPGGHSPVQRAGLVLLALTPEDQLPMQLRLLSLEEVSPRPRLQSLNELHRELEFFERPDRPSIVRDVHERFQRQPFPAAAEPAEPAVPPPLLEPLPPKRRYRWWKRSSVWTGCLIVLVTLAVAAAVWAWPRPEGRWLRANVERLSKATLATGRRAAQAVRREVNGAKWNLGYKPREPRPSVLVLADAEPARTPEVSQNITLEAGAPAPPVQPFQLAETPLAGESGQFVGKPVPRPEPSSAPSQPASGAVFSAADVQVVPPKLVSPRQPARSTEGAGTPPIPEVELLVSPEGEVESVKLISGRTTAISGMQISAIKAWRFEPAMRSGEPVRYRLRVPLTSR